MALCKVFFLGWLETEARAEQMPQADVFVLPSLLEFGGAAVLEAMAISLPVIAFAWGGPVDYLDATCGVLLQMGSKPELIKAITQAILKLARDANFLRAMGQALTPQSPCPKQLGHESQRNDQYLPTSNSSAAWLRTCHHWVD